MKIIKLNEVEYSFNPKGKCSEKDCDIYKDFGYNSNECNRVKCAPFDRKDQLDGNYKKV